MEIFCLHLTNIKCYKNSMLKSIYDNGGFYIGKYEAGTYIWMESKPNYTKPSSSVLLTTGATDRNKVL